ncbi:DUF1648 domain-containing protein [Streptomyces sp. NPDC059166]|uniref:DUF1648 domain-containing protein n=1 Tax=Streptomyces sp. NPDC059166 TaxID=3346752 RepID=UPI0036853D0C
MSSNTTPVRGGARLPASRLVAFGAPFALGAAVYAVVFVVKQPTLPDPVGIHWDASGSADGVTSSPLGLLGLVMGVFAFEFAGFGASLWQVRTTPGSRLALSVLAWATAAFTCAFCTIALLASAGAAEYTDATFPTLSHWLATAGATAAGAAVGFLLARREH